MTTKTDRERFQHRFCLLAAALLVGFLAAVAVWAGAYIFAGESNGVDLILHPIGYTGTQTSLPIEVCIDPASLVPAGSTINDMETPVKNNIAAWNQLQATVGNSLLGSSNNIPSGQLDFESVALHELGHCLGLAHVNAASESGLPVAERDYTKATDGLDNVFNINPGMDGIRGSSDDDRGDDVNLHWFRTDSNDPGQIPLPATIDASTYARDVGMLPAGHTFAANLDRDVAALLGHPSTFPTNTEAVMQQGTFSDEAQRTLSADDVATIRLAASGADQTANTADDYTINLTYGGISSAPGCDLTMSFTNTSSLAFCSVQGAFIASPPGTTHARITSGFMEFTVNANWFLNDVAATCGPPGSGDWTLSQDCVLTQNAVAPASVIVLENVTLTISAGVSLDIDLENHNLTVRSGGKVVIQTGGKIF